MAKFIMTEFMKYVNLDNVLSVTQRHNKVTGKIEVQIVYLNGKLDTFDSNSYLDIDSTDLIPAAPGFQIIRVDEDGKIDFSDVVAFKIDRFSDDATPIPVAFDGFYQNDQVVRSPSGMIYGNNTWYDNLDHYLGSLKSKNV